MFWIVSSILFEFDVREGYKIWRESESKELEIATSTGSAMTETEYLKQQLKRFTEFGPLQIGGPAPDKAGDSSQIGSKLIPESKFFIYVHRRGRSFCEFESCGTLEGRVIRCMGGWLSGDGHPEISDLVGLNSFAVSQGKASIVVVSDKNSKIIGIYPYHTQADILDILSTFPEFEESLYDCTDEEIGWSTDALQLSSLPDNLPPLSGAELQAVVRKAKKTAIIMPDNKVVDSNGQSIYEVYHQSAENSYLIYRALYGYFEQNLALQEDLLFKTEGDAMSWIKNRMIRRGYTLLEF